MTNWRERYNFLAGPSLLGGILWRDWLALLDQNGWGIDPVYALRALSVTACALSNSASARREQRDYHPLLAAVRAEPPIFILGHWRSGTTHLHNLLGLDERLAYPTFYQALFPHTFLTTEGRAAPGVGAFLPRRRLMDNMSQDVATPQEDEFATCAATGCSPYLGLVFPRRRPHYDRYHSFLGVPAQEVRRWQEGLLTFVKKLTWKYQRPLVLKSPPHTCRIRLLLDLFPGARFVHIHRNPFVVFQSTVHLNLVSLRHVCLQRPPRADEGARVLRVFREMYDVFFRERPLIPDGHYHEVSFEELEKDPVPQMKALYEKLALPDFRVVRPRVESYLNSLAGYRKNQFPELSPTWRATVLRAWGREVEEWRYAPGGRKGDEETPVAPPTPLSVTPAACGGAALRPA
jgi:hypothetical protein